MNKITCPNCGAEYAPVEIYVPSSFFGSSNIEKDEKGKIINIYGEGADTTETYRCDYCNRKFYVNTEIKFDTTCDGAEFTEKYVSKLSKPNLFMEEE